MTLKKVCIIGAGAAGLAAAIDLARRGIAVEIFERADEAGGKIRQARIGGARIDCGPTVFTMRWIFEELFEDAGADLDTALTLRPADILARHAWKADGRLDLFADVDRSADAIAEFAGEAEADGYRAFSARAASIYDTLRDPFIRGQRPSQLDVVARVGLAGMPAFLKQIEPLTTLWTALGRYFRDPRLRQLFGRYATYVGSSPFLTPATIMLVAHVERNGVWTAEGGMRAVAAALQTLGEKHGAVFRFNAPVSEIVRKNGCACGVRLDSGEFVDADAVLFNGDVSALGQGLLGPDAASAGRVTPRAKRSLSALTISAVAKTRAFPLSYHNVFFGDDYDDEFDAIFKRRTVCATPTVYLCAQDRSDYAHIDDAERLFFLINAPPDGDAARFGESEAARIQESAFALLSACGLSIEFDEALSERTTPRDFHARFPGTGGALYGQTCHGAMATMARMGARTSVKNLYLCGGSVHPGAGVPMAVMSGRLAAARLLDDHGARR